VHKNIGKLLLFIIASALIASQIPVLLENLNNAYRERSISKIEKLANRGDPDLMFMMGLIYLNGVNVPKNHHGAILWFKRAANRGHKKAFYAIKQVYTEHEEFEDLRDWYIHAAQNGDARAAHFLASMYHKGDKIPKDLHEAAKWYKFGADMGQAISQYWYAITVIKTRGSNTAKDYITAGEYLGKASENGFDDANKTISYYIDDCSKASEGWKISYDNVNSCFLAIHSDDAKVNHVIGQAYIKGWYDLYKTPEESFIHMQKAAHAGNPYSQIAISEYHFNGIGTDKNLIKAYVWYSMGIEKLRGLNEINPQKMNSMTSIEYEMHQQLSQQERAQAVALKQEYIEKYSAGSK